MNNLTVNEIKTVIKYVLIQYRDYNNNLIRTMRQLPSENTIFPNYPNQITTTGSSIIYTFNNGWEDMYGQPANTIVPNYSTTYYANSLIVNLPLAAYINVVGPNESDQTMLISYNIISSEDLLLYNTNYLTYLIKPTTITHEVIGGNNITKVNFKIQYLDYTPGVIKTLEPEFILYKTNQEVVGTIPIKIIVQTSGQSTGD